MKILTIACTIVVALLATAAHLLAQSGYDLFQKALVVEHADGNLRQAIQLYERVVKEFGRDRALAAKALVRSAECYQKLGDPVAQRIYQQIVQDYADQREAVAIARAKVGGGPNGASSSIISRRVLTLIPDASFRGSSISSDGRFITYTDWMSGGDLAVRELATGRERHLTSRAQPGEHDTSAISRDGTRVAFTWFSYETNRYELRVAPLDATAPQSRQLFAIDDVTWLQPFDWSPDGQWIAVQLTRQDRTGQMGLISARDGSLRVLKSSEWRGTNQLFFSPDGKYLGFDLPVGETATGPRDVFILAVDGSREIPAVVNTSDDTMMGWSPDGRRLLFASDRSGSIALWALPVAEGRPQGPPELIKTDISRRSIGVTRSGTLFTGVFLGGRDIHVAAVDFETGTLAGNSVKPIQSFVGVNDTPDWSPDGKHLSYLSRRDMIGLGRVLGIRSMETGQVRELQPKLNYFQQPRWTPDGRSFVVQGRDLRDRQGAFLVDAQTGDARHIGEGVRPQLSPDGKKLYSRPQGNAIVERNIVSGEEREIIRRQGLFAPALSPDGRFVAAGWRDGAARSTSILLVAVSGGDSRELLRVTEPESLDARYLAWMPNGRAVLVSKQSRPGERGELLLVPTDGGTPRTIDLGMRMWGGFGFKVHPNGREIAFVAGENTQEIWVLENFLPATAARR